MPDESLIRSRVAGRQAADALADLYINEAARINAEHGVEGSTAFLERLRDNLIAIRPLPVKEPEKSERPTVIVRNSIETRQWDERDLPERYVLVSFDAEVDAETDKALCIGGKWIPRSQMHEEPEVGEYIGAWPVTAWFAQFSLGFRRPLESTWWNYEPYDLAGWIPDFSLGPRGTLVEIKPFTDFSQWQDEIAKIEKANPNRSVVLFGESPVHWITNDHDSPMEARG